MQTESQKRYNKKKTMFSAVFLPKEENIINILKTYLKENNLSVNSYLRGLIIDDLIKKGLL
mgnify:CR=1 FL=1